MVGAGAKPIIWNLLSALLDPGDELLYADPAYPAYASAASYLEAKPIPVSLLESRNWRLDLDELAAKITPEDQSRRHQLAAQSHRRRAHARGPRDDRRARAAAQLPGHRGRDLLAQRLRTDVRVDHDDRRHARAHHRRRRLLEGVRDDGLAAGLLHRARRDRTARDAVQQQHVLVRRDVRAARRASRRSPATTRRCSR